MKMQLYQDFMTNKGILNHDLFVLLGLENMSEQEKEDYIDKFTKVVLRYLLQEKVKDAVDPFDLPEIMKIYEMTDAQIMMETLSDKVPDFEQLFMDASTEVKIRTVKDYYQATITELNEKLQAGVGDPDERAQIEQKISLAEKNLGHVSEGRFDLINNNK